RLVARRAVLPVTRDRAVNQLGIQGLNTRVSQAQAIHRARPEVFNQHIHFRDQSQAEVPPGWLFQINGNPALATNQDQEECSLLADEWRSPTARKLAAFGRFELIDLGAVI